MMDAFKALGFSKNGWETLASDHKNGKPIDKREVLKLLDKGVIPDAVALPMLAAVIRDETKLKEGIAKNKYNSTWMMQRIVVEAYFSELYGAYIPDDFWQQDDENFTKLPLPNISKKKMNGESPKEAAKNAICSRFGLSSSTFKKILAEKTQKNFFELLIDSAFYRDRTVVDAYFYALYNEFIPDDFYRKDCEKFTKQPLPSISEGGIALAKKEICRRFCISDKTLSNILAQKIHVKRIASCINHFFTTQELPLVQVK